MLESTGFVEVEFGRQVDVFSGSKHESSAASFDTMGINIRGGKPLR